jgi:hypothetical protein
VFQTVLRNNRIIRPLLTGVLLALFALGITPRIAIHALVAHHTDTHLSLQYGHTDQYNKADFHCATDNLVVEFPFLDHSLTLRLGLAPAWPAHRTVVLAKPIAEDHPLFGLRGPPATIPFC